jgi:adenine specific DNA methylase Mod
MLEVILMAGSKLNDIAEKLWKDPSERNWKELSQTLKKAGAKYYNVVFNKGKIAKKDDLREAYAEIFDAKEKQIAKVPVFKSKGKGIEGATIYLKGLLNINK